MTRANDVDEMELGRPFFFFGCSLTNASVFLYYVCIISRVSTVLSLSEWQRTC